MNAEKLIGMLYGLAIADSLSIALPDDHLAPENLISNYSEKHPENPHFGAKRSHPTLYTYVSMAQASAIAFCENSEDMLDVMVHALVGHCVNDSYANCPDPMISNMIGLYNTSSKIHATMNIGDDRSFAPLLMSLPCSVLGRSEYIKWWCYVRDKLFIQFRTTSVMLYIYNFLNCGCKTKSVLLDSKNYNIEKQEYRKGASQWLLNEALMSWSHVIEGTNDPLHNNIYYDAIYYAINGLGNHEVAMLLGGMLGYLNPNSVKNCVWFSGLDKKVVSIIEGIFNGIKKSNN